MKLLLIRHAEASVRAATDAQRRLTEEGIAAVIRQSNNTALPWNEFTSLWVSPYVRTQQTASLLLQHYHQKTHSLSIQRLDSITPHGEINEVQNFLLKQTDEGIILITHQPLISALIGHFCQADEEAVGVPMMPASMALLEGGMPAAGCLKLIHLFHS